MDTALAEARAAAARQEVPVGAAVVRDGDLFVPGGNDVLLSGDRIYMVGLPERIPSAVMIPIGWPVGRHGVPPRASVDTKLFWNTFDATTVEAERPIR